MAWRFGARIGRLRPIKYGLGSGLGGGFGARRLIQTESKQVGSSSGSAGKKQNKNNNGLLITVGVATGSIFGFYFAMKQTLANPPEFIFPHSSKTDLNDIPSPNYANYIEFQLAKEKFIEILGQDSVSELENDIETHTKNNYTLHEPKPHEKPQLILYPTSTEQVSDIMKIAHDYQTPIIPFCGGTSIEGQYISSRQPCVIIDLSKINQIKHFNKSDLDITVGAGTSWLDINEYLDEYGLMLGPDPAPGALIGGMIGTSCSGTNAMRYGTMKESVINLTVVLADGSIIKTKQRAKKTSNGYNLTNLFIGSEGTLGIVTEATLKLHIKPKFETIAVVSFNSILDATNAVTQLISEGVQLNAVELLDERMMSCINFSKQTSKVWDEKPTLFFKIGSNNSKILNELIKDVQKISKNHNYYKFQFAKNESQQQELWSARKSIFWSSIDYGRSQISPNVKIWSTDVAVPISNLSSMIEETIKDTKETGLYTTIVGHVGDGNFHCLVMYDEKDVDKAMSLVNRITERSIKFEGTVSGEHGIGMSKRSHLEKELGIETIQVMRKLKLSLDPLRILNPDKIFKIDPKDNHD
ncbi:D-lactate dehydrogenase [cytochrome],mitochondrial [Wickerhamomyces ciferrii]|uniref:D-lactate dehydrogenase (cytochrome) n=1 Tax=Wickerhamomyces ciferrii (strain ATCC 14091 / BCRC 22168 / CBS 111 / JCM 3599 / NBRC 0793 / NRRL Y-1031 F-60-10) TaxID=1206466 RepID=K0KPX8_WICCF|nr:D-lactate dehydrogenase [cytochrome],mitochondrial [Wickerhamomyces ciferrii]CCH43484.1 D-lactate dehydrogenase [cytochrome],mitochondrial [Wickerhamomyces ciferrii]